MSGKISAVWMVLPFQLSPLSVLHSREEKYPAKRPVQADVQQEHQAVSSPPRLAGDGNPRTANTIATHAIRPPSAAAGPGSWRCLHLRPKLSRGPAVPRAARAPGATVVVWSCVIGAVCAPPVTPPPAPR